MSRSRTSPEPGARPTLMLVLAAPSGAGKSTVARRLFELVPTLAFSISHTTRPPRGAEVDGVEYHFVDDATFDTMVDADGFAEWARVHDRRYGTSHQEIRRLAAAGRDILFDIDVQGAEQLATAYPDAIRVCLTPPSLAVLEARLRGRGTDSAEQVALRLDNARTELAGMGGFDYVVPNHDVETAANDLAAIMRAERLRLGRDPNVIERLLEEANA